MLNPILAQVAFRVLEIDPDQSPTTLLRPLAIPLIGHVVLERREQPRAEPAPGGIGDRDLVLLQQPGEEALRHVLRIFRREALAPDEGIERAPVELAELRQGLACLRPRALARSEHQTPPGGDEPAPSVKRYRRRQGLFHALGFNTE